MTLFYVIGRPHCWGSALSQGAHLVPPSDAYPNSTDMDDVGIDRATYGDRSFEPPAAKADLCGRDVFVRHLSPRRPAVLGRLDGPPLTHLPATRQGGTGLHAGVSRWQRGVRHIGGPLAAVLGGGALEHARAFIGRGVGPGGGGGLHLVRCDDGLAAQVLGQEHGGQAP
jgi:hypothetical protein